MTQVRGSCLCGELGFEAALPSKWVAHCHCSMCRRGSGAAFVTWVGLEAANSRIVDPHGLLHWYRSSEQGERGSCSRCGTPLFFRSARWPGELQVRRANFAGPVDRGPQANVFWDTHVDWGQLNEHDGLPRKTAVQVT